MSCRSHIKFIVLDPKGFRTVSYLLDPEGFRIFWIQKVFVSLGSHPERFFRIFGSFGFCIKRRTNSKASLRPWTPPTPRGNNLYYADTDEGRESDTNNNMPRSPKRPGRQSPRSSTSGRKAKIASASENVNEDEGGENEPLGEEVDAEVEVADANNGGGESQPTTTTTTTTSTTNIAIEWCKADLTAANERLKAAREEFENDYNQLVNELRQEERALDDRLEELNKKMQDDENIHGKSDASIDDTLEMNAGGKIIVVKRSTLTTHTVGTKFGALFSGRWDKKLQRDNHGRIFLDVNSECFQAIVAYLNELMISSEENPPDPPSVDAEYEHILWQQLTLFGLWDSVGMPQTAPTGKTP